MNPLLLVLLLLLPLYDSPFSFAFDGNAVSPFGN
jgi:hypothetical protein